MLSILNRKIYSYVPLLAK